EGTAITICTIAARRRRRRGKGDQRARPIRRPQGVRVGAVAARSPQARRHVARRVQAVAVRAASRGHAAARARGPRRGHGPEPRRELGNTRPRRRISFRRRPGAQGAAMSTKSDAELAREIEEFLAEETPRAQPMERVAITYFAIPNANTRAGGF